MHAIIYGTGNWAKLLASKLKIPYSFVGSSEKAEFKRTDKIPKKLKDSVVFIASETKNHLSDLKLALKTKPSIVFVEKGFANLSDYVSGSKLIKEVPTYILSQYRYSNITKKAKEIDQDIEKIFYDWHVDSNIKEWGYHIVSLDNYIRNQKNMFIVEESKTYKIDNISSFKLTESNERKLDVIITTKNYEIFLSFGDTNVYTVKGKRGIEYFEFYSEEDCLQKQNFVIDFCFLN